LYLTQADHLSRVKALLAGFLNVSKNGEEGETYGLLRVRVRGGGK